MRAQKAASSTMNLLAGSVWWLAAPFAVALLFVAAASARANEMVLFAEAAALLRQSDTPDRAARSTFLEQARERLQRIVVAYPNTATARQLQGQGVPVLGGTAVVLGEVSRWARSATCFALPTYACLIEHVRTEAEANPFLEMRAVELALVGETERRVGAVADATRTFERASAAAFAIPRRDPQGRRTVRDYTLGQVARSQARAGLFDGALVNARQIEDTNWRSRVLVHITEEQARRGEIEASATTARMLSDMYSRSTAFAAVAGAQARALRQQEALATLREIMDEAQQVRALAAIGEAQFRNGRGWQETIERAARTARGIHPTDVYGRVLALTSIGAALARTGITERAVAFFAEALAAARAIPPEAHETDPNVSILSGEDSRSRSDILAMIAVAQADVGLFDEAITTAQHTATNYSARYQALAAAVRGLAASGRFDAAEAVIAGIPVATRRLMNFGTEVSNAFAIAVGRAGRAGEAVDLWEEGGGLSSAILLAAAEGLRRPLPAVAAAPAAQSDRAGTPSPQPAAPGPAPVASVAATSSVRGAPEVISTAVFVLAGERITLAYVEGLDGTPARGIAAFIMSRGGIIACERVPSSLAMRCRTDDGVDLAEAALFNGGARAMADAPPAYRAAELAARQARRGVWAEVQPLNGVTPTDARAQERSEPVQNTLERLRIAQSAGQSPIARPSASGSPQSGGGSASGPAALTQEEIRSVAEQIAECWNPASRLAELDQVVVEVRVQLDSRGVVRQVVPIGSPSSDQRARFVFESVRAALMSPQCNPLRVPALKYQALMASVFRFNQRGLVR